MYRHLVSTIHDDVFDLSRPSFLSLPDSWTSLYVEQKSEYSLGDGFIVAALFYGVPNGTWSIAVPTKLRGQSNITNTTW